ncbi:O-antigen ligase family protein [Rhizobium paknamense]|uniref:Exopolysaccharide production protein ExoQ n=1 Tax=Rhizobium paknamense TaxID=1206817 RepID=A0ABU0IJE9_9HYPH|nr:O-antigen ligase [Rhizobium paknamense]MDQ0458385.1 exopolysaccharide production protein ExoQ [Rhizobium paknamense]
MRIPKALIVDPNANGLYVMAATALSLFIFAYSARIGSISILVFYGLWFLPLLVNYRRVLGDYRRFFWIYSFAILAFVSTFWSAAPPTTLRSSIQYLTHIFCALLAVRVVSMHNFTRGAIFGTGLVLAYSLAFGHYIADALDGSFSFVGAFESKNQLGFFASLGIYFVFASLFIQRDWTLLLLPVYGVVCLMAAYCLFASESATSVLTVIVIIGASVILKAVTWLSPRHRVVLFAGGAFFGIVAAFAFIYGGGFALILGAFGKDTTLTGRTYLWAQGLEAAKLNPILGMGYQAYWVQGFSEAERLWAEFFIQSRNGFHFHNTYIETTVELGIVGLLNLCMLMLTAVFGNLKRLLSNAHDPEAGLLFGLALLLLIRSFVEIDTLAAYQVGSFLLYFIIGRLALNRMPVTIAAGRSRGRGRRRVYDHDAAFERTTA